jgi:CheY-like chemotaxis protein
MDARSHHLAWEGVDPALSVHGDITRLVQVVGNLLNNAAKYTPPGGRIALRAREEQQGLAITVDDDGVGIPTELLQRVFERFVQVGHHADSAGGGLGIGLSVVKSLVEMHGGRVAAESTGPGGGSRFTIWLPRAQASGPGKGTGQFASEPAAATRRRILIVDDNHDAAETLGMIVEMAGHEVHLAHDGLSALRIAQSREPDVVFLDIGMPGMDGYEAAARMRALPGGQHRMLVALTGWGTEDDRAKTLRAGFDLHLTKPVDPSVVDGLLARPRRASTSAS